MRRYVVVLAGLLLAAWGSAGCNSAGVRGGTGGTSGTGGGGVPPVNGTGGKPMNLPCEGLGCNQSTCVLGPCAVKPCPNGGRTTVSGTIRDPAGKNPLYNITVYVPNKKVAPIVDGPTCDPCDQATGTSALTGDPLTVARTDVAGKFSLGAVGIPGASGGDVPAGDNIPLVIQVGKWRREITIPKVTACTNLELNDANQLRLPANQGEGHIPKFAITTGNKDSLECLLRKVGVADSEFTPEAGAGRVNLYAGGGGATAYAPTLNAGAAYTLVHPWWDSLDNLKKYDIVLHDCEGGDGTFQGMGSPPSEKSPAARQALMDFANLGGRVFGSHWHVYWLENGPPAFQTVGTFEHRQGLPRSYDASIDQGFPGGRAMSQWMMTVGGSTMPGFVTITQDANQRTVDRVTGLNVSQRWIYASTLTPPSVLYLSATTPVPGGECGRVVFSDIHVSSGVGTTNIMPFPTGCDTLEMTPQEKVLEFMLFDIATCVAPIVP